MLPYIIGAFGEPIPKDIFEENRKLFLDKQPLDLIYIWYKESVIKINHIWFKDQYRDGGFIEKTDFPIYVNEYHQISFAKKDDIQLSEKVRTFCDKLFERI